MADAKAEYAQTHRALKDDEEYLEELQELCASKAKDHKQRVKSRLSEMAALKEAMRVMQEKVAELDRTVNGEMVPNFLQEVMEHSQELEEPHHHMQGQLVQESARSKLSEEAQLALSRAMKVASLLETKGKSLQSFRLSGLAARMQNRADGNVYTDTLTEVKGMVQELINDLVDEAAAESTEKGFCDSQMGSAARERDRRMREATRQSAKLGGLDVVRTDLLESIDILNDDIYKSETDLNKEIADRANESATNLEVISAANTARKAVKAATLALKDFYAGQKRKARNYDVKKAAYEKAGGKHADNPGLSLMQFDAEAGKQDSAPDPLGLKGQPAAGAGFDGSYNGKQDAALGIYTMMEVIMDDFERTEIDTKADEKKAAAEFLTHRQKTKVYIQKKKTKRSCYQEDLASAEASLEKGKKTLEATVDLLDGALKILEELKPRCVDNRMSYEERMARRESEMESLTTAMCMLDGDGVEDRCKDGKPVTR
eukprot:TRINITY_DN23734_c0_g1_i2.p1 TRINITY_DN23734_c0_g1~~TRINITY_DN23734_c0_g1_i2.p1  ORF type:complete len:487 (-),score=155.31 TRINITY_DN23734_c0_g1_i2:51-1511(-)